MSSSSSFADSDSTSSFLTPSLEFPDRISFREMDLSEAGPSSRDRISFQIQGVEGEIDRINLSPGVFGPDDLAISLEACKKRSFSDSHKVQAQHLSEAGPSGVVVASSSTNQDIAELMPSELSEIGNLSTPVDRVVVDGGTPGRDAARNINYDVASSSSSSAEDLSVSTSSLMTRSLEFPEPTSFRIGGGGEGEMDRIYRSLGVSGPDDLAISFDAWEACKKRSSSDVVNRFKPFDLDNHKSFVRRLLPSMGSEGSGGPYHPCEIMTELVIQLLIISRKSWRYTNTAKQLIALIESNRPMISKIQYSGVELPNHRQAQIRMFVEKLEKGKKLTDKVLSSRRWNLYRQLTLARKMEQLEKTISGICKDAVFTHILADVHNLLAVRWSSSSSSSVNSESTFSFLTPSLEFPDRISFREKDLSEAAPRGTVVNRENTELTSSESIEIRHFSNPEDMVLVTSWLKGQLPGRGSFGSIYEGMSIDGDFFAVSEVSLLDQGSQAQECIHQLEAETTLSQLQHHDIMSSSSSFADSDSTYSFMTPSLEFPDRISFREMDLSEAGPSGTVADQKIRVPPSRSRFEIVEVE